jgi:uncharacterized protein DUF4190
MPASTAMQPAYSQAMSPAYPYGARTNSLAVASLIFGIASWCACPFVGGVAAVILGHIARGQIRRTGEAGGGLALAGLILGYLHLVGAVLVTAIWLVLLGGFLAVLGTIGNVPSPSP